jgi:hypothetical protein
MKVTDEQFMESYNNHKGKGHGFKSIVAKELDIANAGVTNRINKLKRNGIIPLDSGNHVESGMILSKSSTYHYGDKETGKPAQWLTANVKAEEQLTALREAVSNIMTKVIPFDPIDFKGTDATDELINMYLSNDLHLGAMMWGEETHDRDWDTCIAADTYKAAIDYLIINSPDCKYGMVVDLGDLTEMDDFKNATPHSGNQLDVDGRYSKVLQVACEVMEYAVYRALEKHETVYFVNISGNHDITTGHSIRLYIMARFKDNPRVIIDKSPRDIKYHKHGTTLLGFAHGDGLKMNKAGEVMAIDNQLDFSSTVHRYFHFGHNHKDSVIDGGICKAESHRNLAPLNNWASHKGFRGSAGTMKCITYSDVTGYTGTTNYNVCIKEK